eukprot:scaffold978_cov392-Prasinococcus_capsulatus_cf.AAC.19
MGADSARPGLSRHSTILGPRGGGAWPLWRSTCARKRWSVIRPQRRLPATKHHKHSQPRHPPALSAGTAPRRATARVGARHARIIIVWRTGQLAARACGRRVRTPKYAQKSIENILPLAPGLRHLTIPEYFVPPCDAWASCSWLRGGRTCRVEQVRTCASVAALLACLPGQQCSPLPAGAPRTCTACGTRRLLEYAGPLTRRPL